MELVVFIGIPGCGKTSFYKEQFFSSHIRVSLDMLHTRNKENKLLEFCFDTFTPAVIDNTNVKAADREKYIALAKQRKYKVMGYYFKTDVKRCIERNNSRQGKEKVPLVGIYTKLKQLEQPKYEEGFDELYHVTIEGNAFVVRAWNESDQ